MNVDKLSIHSVDEPFLKCLYTPNAPGCENASQEQICNLVQFCM